MWTQRRLSVTRADLKGRFSYLLVVMVLALVAGPFLGGQLVGRLILQVIFSAVLLAAVYAATTRDRSLVLAALIALPPLIMNWMTHFVIDHAILVVIAHGLVVAVLCLTILTVLARILKDQRVTAETISGALCVYLLIGFTGAFLYSLAEFIQPGALEIPGRDQPEEGGAERYFYPHAGFSLMVYYSFVTLATVGYGDITPVSPAARTVSILQAIIGQLYLAVLIARLVGMHVSHSSRRDDPR